MVIYSTILSLVLLLLLWGLVKTSKARLTLVMGEDTGYFTFALISVYVILRNSLIPYNKILYNMLTTIQQFEDEQQKEVGSDRIVH